MKKERNTAVYSFRRSQFTQGTSSLPGQPVSVIDVDKVQWAKEVTIVSVFAGIYANDSSGVQKDLGMTFGINSSSKDIFDKPMAIDVITGTLDLRVISLTSNGGQYIDYRPPGGLKLFPFTEYNFHLFVYDMKAGDKLFANVQLTALL